MRVCSESLFVPSSESLCTRVDFAMGSEAVRISPNKMQTVIRYFEKTQKSI